MQVESQSLTRLSVWQMFLHTDAVVFSGDVMNTMSLLRQGGSGNSAGEVALATDK